MKNIYIIGAGGVGSWLTPSMCLLVGPDNVTVIDGDTLEEGNLNRQLFTPMDIGRNKAMALAVKYGCKSRDVYFANGLLELSGEDWLICCADNNPARLECLKASDDSGPQVIIAANETTSAEAYYYSCAFNGNRNPRNYYPEIVTDIDNDPRAMAVGCTGSAQTENRQLVSANFMAAALAQHLFVLWGIEYQKMNSEERRELFARLPYRLRANLSKLEYDPMPLIKDPYDLAADVYSFMRRHKITGSATDLYMEAIKILGEDPQTHWGWRDVVNTVVRAYNVENDIDNMVDVATEPEREEEGNDEEPAF